MQYAGNLLAKTVKVCENGICTSMDNLESHEKNKDKSNFKNKIYLDSLMMGSTATFN